MTFDPTDYAIVKLAAILLEAEGNERYAYKDSLGKLTIGIGRCIDASVKGSGLTPEERATLLHNDIVRVRIALEAHLPWIHTLDEVRVRALRECYFVLDLKLLEFHTFLSELQAGSYANASAALLSSLWHHQAPKRVERIANTILTGVD